MFVTSNSGTKSNQQFCWKKLSKSGFLDNILNCLGHKRKNKNVACANNNATLTVAKIFSKAMNAFPNSKF